MRFCTGFYFYFKLNRKLIKKEKHLPRGVDRAVTFTALLQCSSQGYSGAFMQGLINHALSRSKSISSVIVTEIKTALAGREHSQHDFHLCPGFGPSSLPWAAPRCFLQAHRRCCVPTLVLCPYKPSFPGLLLFSCFFLQT